MKNIDIQTLYKLLFADYPDIVTVRQLQVMLGISRHAAYDLLTDGSIRGLKLGNAYKIPKINVIRYVADKRTADAGRKRRYPSFLWECLTAAKGYLCRVPCGDGRQNLPEQGTHHVGFLAVVAWSGKVLSLYTSNTECRKRTPSKKIFESLANLMGNRP